jgi:hypothetical protein
MQHWVLFALLGPMNGQEEIFFPPRENMSILYAHIAEHDNIMRSREPGGGGGGAVAVARKPASAVILVEDTIHPGRRTFREDFFFGQ